jgi:hypothetical protein
MSTEFPAIHCPPYKLIIYYFTEIHPRAALRRIAGTKILMDYSAVNGRTRRTFLHKPLSFPGAGHRPPVKEVNMRNDDLFSRIVAAFHFRNSAIPGILVICLIAGNSEAQVKLPAVISSDTTLTHVNSYYTADSSITIPEGITLTINEGTIFRFKADTGAVIVVFGTLIINGTEDHPVECALMDNKANTDTTRWGYISSDHGTLKLNYVKISQAHRFISAFFGTVHLSHCYAEKTYWTGTLDCVGIHNAADVLVEYCEFHGNPKEGADCIDLDSIGTGIVRHNTFRDFKDDGIDVGHDSYNFTIDSNYIYNCSNGITIGEHSKATFTRNIISSCQMASIEVHTGAYIKAVNNTFYKNKIGIRCDHLGSANTAGSADVKNTIFANIVDTLYQVQDSSVVNFSYCISNTDTVALPGKNNMLDPPGLVNPENGNFSLSKNSPCINHGDPADTADACGAPIDIGAIEYNCKGVTPVAHSDGAPNEYRGIGFHHHASAGTVQIGSGGSLLHYPCRICFYRLDGRLIKAAIVENNDAAVPIRNLKAGLYMVELYELNNPRKAFRGKLLIKK